MSNNDTRAGSVKWFSQAAGYGFLKDDEIDADDIFIHASQLAASGMGKSLIPGDRIGFELEINRKNGRVHATNLRRLFPESRVKDAPAVRFGDVMCDVDSIKGT